MSARQLPSCSSKSRRELTDSALRRYAKGAREKERRRERERGREREREREREWGRDLELGSDIGSVAAQAVDPIIVMLILDHPGKHHQLLVQPTNCRCEAHLHRLGNTLRNTRRNPSLTSTSAKLSINDARLLIPIRRLTLQGDAHFRQLCQDGQHARGQLFHTAAKLLEVKLLSTTISAHPPPQGSASAEVR